MSIRSHLNKIADTFEQTEFSSESISPLSPPKSYTVSIRTKIWSVLEIQISVLLAVLDIICRLDRVFHVWLRVYMIWGRGLSQKIEKLTGSSRQ